MDDWCGGSDPNDPVFKVAQLYTPDELYQIFLENVEYRRGKNARANPVIPYPGSSRFIAGRWDRIGKPLDVVFLDGDHSYEAVCDDIKLWVPHIKSGGILCGHDYRFTPVQRAVKEFGIDAAIRNVWYKRI